MPSPVLFFFEGCTAKRCSGFDGESAVWAAFPSQFPTCGSLSRALHIYFIFSILPRPCQWVAPFPGVVLGKAGSGMHCWANRQKDQVLQGLGWRCPDNEFLVLILLPSAPPELLRNHFRLNIQEKQHWMISFLWNTLTVPFCTVAESLWQDLWNSD